MTRSSKINHIATALAEFQQSVGPVLTDANGERTRYATLAKLREASALTLAQLGLAVVQSGGYDTIETTILHTSGQWITMTATCARSAGSNEVGYGARHAFMLALGLTELDEYPPGLGRTVHVTVGKKKLSPDEIIEQKRRAAAEEPA